MTAAPAVQPHPPSKTDECAVYEAAVVELETQRGIDVCRYHSQPGVRDENDETTCNVCELDRIEAAVNR